MSQRNDVRDESLTPAARALVRANLSLMDDVIHRDFARFPETSLPYLRALAAPGLIDAAQTYDVDRGAQFRTYAWTRIRGAIRNGLRRDRSCTDELVERGVLSADEYAAWQGDSPESRQDTEPQAAGRFSKALHGYAAAWTLGWAFGGSADDPEAVLQRGAGERVEVELWTTCDTLPERDRQVIDLRDRQRLTWPKVAAAMSVSVATAHRYHHAAMGRLGDRVRAQLGIDDGAAALPSRR